MDSVEYITNNTYTMSDIDKNKLYDYGFRYSKINSEEGCTIYKYTFPVCKYKKHATLYGEIFVSIESGEIAINVYDNTGTPYAPFYYTEYGNYTDIQKAINNKILSEMQKISKETKCTISNLSLLM